MKFCRVWLLLAMVALITLVSGCASTEGVDKDAPDYCVLENCTLPNGRTVAEFYLFTKNKPYRHALAQMTKGYTSKYTMTPSETLHFMKEDLDKDGFWGKLYTPQEAGDVAAFMAENNWLTGIACIQSGKDRIVVRLTTSDKKFSQFYYYEDTLIPNSEYWADVNEGLSEIGQEIWNGIKAPFVSGGGQAQYSSNQWYVLPGGVAQMGGNSRSNIYYRIIYDDGEYFWCCTESGDWFVRSRTTPPHYSVGQMGKSGELVGVTWLAPSQVPEHIRNLAR